MGGNKTPIVDEGHLFQGGPNWVENYHANLMESEAPMELTEAPPALRRLTLKEAAAIQTFPKEYKFSGPMSSQYTQIGNAVPCGLAEAVASAVKAALLGLDYEEECNQNEFAFSVG
jgi:DNA (cytosine-5)-methyltransferase 1